MVSGMIRFIPEAAALLFISITTRIRKA